MWQVSCSQKTQTLFISDKRVWVLWEHITEECDDKALYMFSETESHFSQKLNPFYDSISRGQ